jgi:hypothetical protein
MYVTMGDRLTVDPTNPAYASQTTPTNGYPASSTYPQTNTQTATPNSYPNTYYQTGGPVYSQPTTNGHVANTPYGPQSTGNGANASGYPTQGTASAYTPSYQGEASNPPTYSQPSSNAYPNAYQQQQATPSYTMATTQSGMTSYPAVTQQTYNTAGQPSTYAQQPAQGAYYYQ